VFGAARWGGDGVGDAAAFTVAGDNALNFWALNDENMRIC